MTKRRKDTDYLFLSARIRAMERRLLTAQRLEQLLTAPSVEACAQLLSEWGYAPVHDEPSLQAALSAQREAVFADVSRFMPEAEVLDVFRLKYDYHNIKTLLKAPQDAERLLIDAGTVPAETMRKKHAENGGWDFLPADMAAAADEAQRVLAETGSARSSDCILDRAYFARLEKLAADSHIPYLQDYVRAMIDAANPRHHVVLPEGAVWVGASEDSRPAEPQNRCAVLTSRVGQNGDIVPLRQRDAGGDPRRKRQRRCRAVAGHGLRPGGGAGRRGRQGRQPDRL